MDKCWMIAYAGDKYEPNQWYNVKVVRTTLVAAEIELKKQAAKPGNQGYTWGIFELIKGAQPKIELEFKDAVALAVNPIDGLAPPVDDEVDGDADNFDDFGDAPDFEEPDF